MKRTKQEEQEEEGNEKPSLDELGTIEEDLKVAINIQQQAQTNLAAFQASFDTALARFNPKSEAVEALVSKEPPLEQHLLDQAIEVLKEARENRDEAKQSVNEAKQKLEEAQQRVFSLQRQRANLIESNKAPPVPLIQYSMQHVQQIKFTNAIEFIETQEYDAILSAI